jgi:hypothetical protein
MSVLVWDAATQRFYETGVDHGVLYPAVAGLYPLGVAWNGLTTVTESPSGAESTKTYADNILYANLLSKEFWGGTIEAYTYPAEFEPCDGQVAPEPGVSIGQQPRQSFGFAYRTIKGNDTEGNGYAEKLHLVYGCLAAPSEKANTTVNDSPAMVNFSWAVSSTPVVVDGYDPTSTITIDSSTVDADSYQALKDLLYGTEGTDPTLPMPNEVLALFAGTVTEVFPTAPTYDNGTHLVTIPSVTGVVYKINGVTQTAGTHAQTADFVVHAVPAPAYVFSQPSVDEWFFDYS